MFTKSIIVSVFVVVAVVYGQHQPAAQYPAGVDPSSCPSYPNCDNAALHNQQPHNAGQWNPAPAPQQWNAPNSWNNQQDDGQWHDDTAQWNSHDNSGQYNPAPSPQWNAAPAQQWNPAPAPQWGAPALHGPPSNHLSGGDKYPAGVNPQSCPNYPYCDNAAGVGSHAPQVAPLPGWNERVYPAGVSPHQCPNFPYCN